VFKNIRHAESFEFTPNHHPTPLRSLLNLKMAVFWIVAPYKSQQLVSSWDLNQELAER
jgi:hypothetical protein